MNTQKRRVSIRRDSGIVWILFVIALFTFFIDGKYSLQERFLFAGLFFLFWYIYIVICLFLFKATIGMATTKTRLYSSVSDTLTFKQVSCYGFVYWIRVLSSFARRPGRYELSEDDVTAEQR